MIARASGSCLLSKGFQPQLCYKRSGWKPHNSSTSQRLAPSKELGVNVGLTTKLLYSKPVSASIFKRTVNQFDFEGKGEIEFGAQAKTDVPSWVGQLTLKAYGKSGVYTEKIIASSELNPDGRFKFGFNALVAGVNAVLELGGVDLVNYKYEKTILNKYQVWPQEK